MNASDKTFNGRWLQTGSRHGQQFSHDQAEYDHSDDTGATPMRHVYVDQNGQQVGVWVPATWSDEQARESLENNW